MIQNKDRTPKEVVTRETKAWGVGLVVIILLLVLT